METLEGLYREARQRGMVATSAISYARQTVKFTAYSTKVRTDWESLDGDVWSEWDKTDVTKVRLRIVPDSDVEIVTTLKFWALDNLFGDTYDPEVNTDISPERLECEKQAEIDRINREGVYGIIGEYNCNGVWEHADSVWGFVGDDWKESGYDIDIMAATIEAYYGQTYCRLCHSAR